MNRVEDLEINKAIRRVFVKHFIDLGKISIRTTNGSVMIYGKLDRMYGINQELTTNIVNSIFDDISKIKNIKRLNIELENWINVSGKWIKKNEVDKKFVVNTDETIFKIDTKENHNK